MQNVCKQKRAGSHLELKVGCRVHHILRAIVNQHVKHTSPQITTHVITGEAKWQDQLCAA